MKYKFLSFLFFVAVILIAIALPKEIPAQTRTAGLCLQLLNTSWETVDCGQHTELQPCQDMTDGDGMKVCSWLPESGGGVFIFPPTNLTATPGDCGNNWLDISWEAPTIWMPGNISYQLFRDNTSVYTGTGTSYRDGNLTLGSSHNYTVKTLSHIDPSIDYCTSDYFGMQTVPTDGKFLFCLGLDQTSCDPAKGCEWKVPGGSGTDYDSQYTQVVSGTVADACSGSTCAIDSFTCSIGILTWSTSGTCSVRKIDNSIGNVGAVGNTAGDWKKNSYILTADTKTSTANCPVPTLNAKWDNGTDTKIINLAPSENSITVPLNYSNVGENGSVLDVTKCDKSSDNVNAIPSVECPSVKLIK